MNGGLALLLDVLVAPSTAFASLRVAPRWVWAVVLTSVLGMAGGYLEVPANANILNYTMAHGPQFTSLSPADFETAKKTTGTLLRFAWLALPIQVFVSAAFVALVLLGANAIGRGSADFAKLFALAANVDFLNLGVAFFLHGIVATIRGPQAFQTAPDLLGTLPSLGWLAPTAPPHLQAFLTSLGVFQLWSLVLFALGLRTIANVSRPIARGASIVLAVCGGSFAALAAR